MGLFPYIGSKNRIKYTLSQYIPDDVTQMASPFLGAGSFELFCANELGIRVHAADDFAPLVHFWNCLQRDPRRLKRRCAELLPRTKDEHSRLLDIMRDGRFSPLSKGAAFFDSIRTSFGGIVYGTFMAKEVPALMRAITQLDRFDLTNMRVSKTSFEKFIPRHTNKWMYVDPPYCYDHRFYGTNSGSHLDSKRFDHAALHAVLQKHPCWMLSYNDCPYIRELYAAHRIVVIHVPYCVKQNGEHRKTFQELLIFSKKYPFPKNM